MITFSSTVGPRVMMFDDVGGHMLDLIEKPRTKEGVIIVEDLDAALQRLRSAVAHSRVRDTVGGDRSNVAHDHPGDDRRSSISLAQRAQPLMELLTLSLQARQPVVWK